MVKRYRNREGAVEAKILEILMSQGKAYGSQISRRAEIPIGSITNSLGSAVRNGLIERDDERNWYLTEKGIRMAMLNREYETKRRELDAQFDRPRDDLFKMYGFRPEGTGSIQCGIPGEGTASSRSEL